MKILEIFVSSYRDVRGHSLASTPVVRLHDSSPGWILWRMCGCVCRRLLRSYALTCSREFLMISSVEMFKTVAANIQKGVQDIVQHTKKKERAVHLKLSHLS